MRKGLDCDRDAQRTGPDTWETIASCFQLRLINHWIEETEELWKRQQITMVTNKNGKLTMRGRLPCCTRSVVSTPRHCSNWQDRLFQRDGARNTVTSMVNRRTKLCGCSEGLWNRQQNSRFRHSWLLHLITSPTTRSSKRPWLWVFHQF